ncbi:MAG: hypothetical protein B1H06_03455 [Candidatus Cloacimonas sp. 4484_143]|nr:MAG: hypothetical protein B1H06_03455 [Candidatus Cloacimonas sp. 4484_143]
MFKFKYLILFLVIFLSLHLHSAEQRPEIGLTLSGGGARGIAHIGVLKVMEEAGIKVDYISGTSMGSIIGGLYAIGYTPAEMEKIILEQDWDAILLDKISLRSISMEEKDDVEKYIGSFPIESGKINLPVGLVAGQQIYSFINKLCISVHHIEDFSDFPIPFLCIATDIEKGKEVVLKGGFLPDAIRASISIPSLFAPIEIDGQLLVDGGLVRNFPVSHALDMGADFVIGVDVGVPLYSKKDLNSLARILNQAITFQSVEINKSESDLCDILIKPAVNDYSIMDFNKAEELIAIGEEAGRKMLPELIKLKEEQSHFPSSPEIIPLTKIEKVYIKNIHIQGLRNVSKNLVIGKLNISKKSWLDTSELQQAIDRIYGSQYFEKVSYKLEPAQNGVDLFVRVVEKSSSNLNFGLHYDNDLDASILINTTFRNKLIMGSKLAIDAKLGNNKAFKISYFIHTGWKPGFGFGITGDRKEYKIPIYNQDQQKTANYSYSTNSTILDVQTIFSNSITLGGGTQFKYTKLKPEIIQNNWAVSNLDYQQMIFHGYCQVNTYDRMNYPRKGVKILADFKQTVELEHSLVEEGYLDDVRDPIDSSIFKISVVDRLIGNLYYEETIKCGSLTHSDSLQDDSFFYLGGMNEPEINFMPFYGYKFMSLSTSNFVLMSSNFYYEISDGIFVSLKGNWVRLGSSFDDVINKKQNYFGWAVTAGWITPIGPLEISYAGGDDKNDNYYYVNIGFYY